MFFLGSMAGKVFAGNIGSIVGQYFDRDRGIEAVVTRDVETRNEKSVLFVHEKRYINLPANLTTLSVDIHSDTVLLNSTRQYIPIHELKAGDKVLIYCNQVEETFPAQTGARKIIKVTR